MDQIQEETTQNMEDEQPQLLNLGSINISEIIKSAQSSNGLKHFDYARYRKYCSLKVKRIRKGLKFTHGKKYQPKDIINERANEPKMLQVLLFEAEKNWAFAMHLKSLVNQTVAKKKLSTRSKFRLRSKLKRALQWGQKLSKVCETRTEKRSSLEAEAYAAQLQGMYNFEIEQWEKATEAYIKCRSIFTEIIKVTDNLQAVLYREKIEQIDQALRYCNHKASRGKSLMTLESILEMKQNIRDPALSQKLEELLDLHRKEQIEQKQGLLDIEYHGEKLPIKNTKVLVLLSKIDETKINITQNKERITQGNEFNQIIELHEQNLENYISLFSIYDDAIKLVTKDRDEQTNSEAEKSIFTKVLGYLNLQRQVAVLERNDVNIQVSVVKFLKEDGASNLQNLQTKKALKQKLTTPQEIVKHCDNYLQVLRQIMDVERMNPDLSMFKIMNVQESICRALRCFFLACLYFSNFKYQEAVSMLKFNEELITAAKDKLQENIQLFGKENVLSVFDFFPKIQPQLLLKCKLNALREQDTSQILIGQQLQSLTVDEQQPSKESNQKSIIHFCKDKEAQGLNLDNIQTYRKADLTDLMSLVLPKPIQFDLAYDQIQFPSLEEKKVQQQKSGFWGKLNIFKK